MALAGTAPLDRLLRWEGAGLADDAALYAGRGEQRPRAGELLVEVRGPVAADHSA